MAMRTETTRPIPRLALSRAELAVSIGVCGNTVDQMVVDGLLPPPRRIGKRKLWPLAAVETALQSWPEDEVSGKNSRLPIEEDWTSEV